MKKKPQIKKDTEVAIAQGRISPKTYKGCQGVTVFSDRQKSNQTMHRKENIDIDQLIHLLLNTGFQDWLSRCL